jgi:hypothetical protein
MDHTLERKKQALAEYVSKIAKAHAERPELLKVIGLSEAEFRALPDKQRWKLLRLARANLKKALARRI